MSWQHFLFDTRSGILDHEVHLEKHSWTTRLNGYGTGSSSIVLAARAPRDGWRAATTPWSKGICSLWDGDPWYAAPLDWRHERWTPHRLEVRHAEVWKLLARRFLAGVTDYDAAVIRRANGVSQRGLITLLLNWVAGSGAPSSRWHLPIVLGGEIESGPLFRSFEPYRFERVTTLIEQVLEEAGAPDVHLRPRINASGRLEWQAEIGDPRVAGPSLRFQWGPERSQLEGLKITEDASDQYTGAFGLGQGSGPEMLIGRGATGLDLDLPVMDVSVAQKQIKLQQQIDAFAQGYIDQHRSLQTQYDYGVKRAALDRGAKPGARIALRVEGSVLQPSTAWQQQYVVAASGGLTDSVTLGVQAL